MTFPGKTLTGGVHVAAPVHLPPIGIIHTPHTDPAQTPRQPIHAADYTGRVEIFPEFMAGLEGLERFARIWLIFAFHRAEAPRLQVIRTGRRRSAASSLPVLPAVQAASA